MATAKKRKVEIEPTTQVLSAFALRKQLLQQKESTAEDATRPSHNLPGNTPASGQLAAGPVSAVRALRSRQQSGAVQEKEQERQGPERSPKLDAEPGSGPVFGAAPPRAESVEKKTGEVVQLPRDSAEGTASPAPRPRREAPILRSSFRPTKQNCQRRSDGSALLRLVEGERLVVLGSYGVSVRSGSVTLAGATLAAAGRTPHWVHAPLCHALPVLRCVDDAVLALHPHPAADALRQMSRLSPLFVRLWNEPDESAPADTTFQILYTADDGPSRSVDLVAPPQWNKAISELMAARKTRGSGSSGRPVVFVCGPKGSGKSTFSRLLTNRVVTDSAVGQGREKRRVAPGIAVLDIDPGQPEYGPPGSVSLVHVAEPNLSAPFCHPFVSPPRSKHSDSNGGRSRLVRSHSLVSVTPATDAAHYIDCVLDLYAVYHRDLRARSPLVVNTPGWVQGTGLDILAELIRRMRPSQVLYMSVDGPDDTVQALASAYQHVPLVELPSLPSDSAASPTPRTPLQLRAMQTMAYFHLDLGVGVGVDVGDGGGGVSNRPSPECLFWDPTPVSAMRPWVVPYSGERAGILGVVCYDFQPASDLLADSLNGIVVSIVAVERWAAFRTAFPAEDGLAGLTMDVDNNGSDDASDRAHIPFAQPSPEGIPLLESVDGGTLDPRHSHCIGAALIRGIDPRRRVFHLLTPIPVAELVNNVMVGQDGKGIVLVAGKLDPPTWAYTEDLYRQRQQTSGGAQGLRALPVNAKSGAALVASGQDRTSEEREFEDEDDEDEDDDDCGLLEGGAGGPAPAEPDMLDGRFSTIPWVETLRGNQKRATGSRVWRVRRDLGRNSGGGS